MIAPAVTKSRSFFFISNSFIFKKAIREKKADNDIFQPKPSFNVEPFILVISKATKKATTIKTKIRFVMKTKFLDFKNK